jgi:hypothetical protein
MVLATVSDHYRWQGWFPGPQRGQKDIKRALWLAQEQANTGMRGQQVTRHLVKHQQIQQLAGDYRHSALDENTLWQTGMNTKHNSLQGYSLVGLHWWQNPVTGKREVLVEGLRVTWGEGEALRYMALAGFEAIYRAQCAEGGERALDEEGQYVAAFGWTQGEWSPSGRGRLLAATEDEMAWTDGGYVLYRRRGWHPETSGIYGNDGWLWHYGDKELLLAVRKRVLQQRAAALRLDNRHDEAAIAELELGALNA